MRNKQSNNPERKHPKDKEFIPEPEKGSNDTGWFEQDGVDLLDDVVKFSYYNPPISNTIPNKTVTVQDVFEMVKGDNMANATAEYRRLLTEIGKKKAGKYKNNKFPYVTPAGVFTKRGDAYLEAISGLMVLDFDDLKNLETVRQRLIEDKVLSPKLIFTSPGGEGLKVIIGINPSFDDLELKSNKLGRWWEAINNYLSIHYDDCISPEKINEFIDGACKDLSRACYLCHDPNAWYSDNDAELNEGFITEYKPHNPVDQIKGANNTLPTNGRPSTEQKEAKTDTYAGNLEWIVNPFDDYNQQAPLWEIEPLIEDAGFSEAYRKGDQIFYKRNGSDNSQGGNFHIKENVFYSFTGNSLLEVNKGYSPAGLLQAIKFDGDGKECFKWLIGEGYGEKAPETTKTAPESKNDSNPFPVDVFPEPMQDIINEINKVLLAPLDFVAAAVLWNVSVAIGNTYKAYAMKGRSESAILYITLVGSPGSNKTFPLKFLMKGLEEKNEELNRVYKAELKLWKEATSKHKKNEPLPEKPVRKQYIIMDTTPEALLGVLQNNPRGLGGYYDELTGWYGNFNQYNKGNEKALWLSGWNGGQYIVNRKQSDDIFIKDFFVSIIGGIQPDPLIKLVSETGRDGFIDRILFTILENEPPLKFKDEQISDRVLEDWDTIIERVIEANTSGATIDIPLSSEAKEVWTPWFNDTHEKALQEPDAIAGIHMKMVSYSIRFALILELCNWACKDQGLPPKEINKKSITGALELCKYFTNTAIKVYDMVSGSDGMKFKNETQRNIYNDLPNNFSTSDAKAVAKKHGLAERTIGNWLNDRSIYKRIAHGKYEKV